jgi:hypothetical protein
MTGMVMFPLVFAAYGAGHQLGDYWIQTHRQALAKDTPGWTGRRACAAHVATYTLTLASCLAVAAWWLAVPVSPARAAAGLAVSAASHYVADRRRPLARLAALAGKQDYYASGGAALLDQAWHWTWLFAAALITAGGPS